LKIAIVHDWLVLYAGSERCVESFTNIWPDADVFTLVNFLTPDEQKRILKNKIPTTSFLQNWKSARRNHRKFLPLFPYAIEQFDLSGYDLIISSSHAVAKGVLTNSNQLHINYCHTPIRYAWDLTHQYLNESGLSTGIKGLIAKAILHYIRIWDVSASNRVDYFVANSKYIAGRIKKTYRREAEVIYPPVDTANFPLQSEKENFYLAASRFVPYKRIDLIVEAFSKMPEKRLVIIGEGPDRDKLLSKATGNIEFIGYQPQEKLKEYMQKAKAFVFAADEDFGIMIIEALSCGTPVIAFNKGGAAETIIDNKTGIHFNEQTADSIVEAVVKFENSRESFSPENLNEYAKQFDRNVFEQKIKSFVDVKCNEFFNK
jgi:glycosyltransferase involved in cell wall biosynthesis